MQTGEESLKRLGLDVLTALVCRESTPRCQAKKGGDCWNSQWAAQCPALACRGRAKFLSLTRQVAVLGTKNRSIRQNKTAWNSLLRKLLLRPRARVRRHGSAVRPRPNSARRRLHVARGLSRGGQRFDDGTESPGRLVLAFLCRAAHPSSDAPVHLPVGFRLRISTHSPRPRRNIRRRSYCDFGYL